ncbi:hypothetical protein PIB30_012510 [Stylosanthes scabra]|uniref:Uncharacterized protein n=1 Tax=Stylosanthes scabra TaxID=79078 RepID=A0ABU6U8T5_9FABA|nr:hypothetical protein [Stylosanthes scabra]
MTFLRGAASSSSAVLAIYTLLVAIFQPAIIEVQSLSPSPAPAPAPTSDGTSIDQGIAYVLMLVALVLTYLIHPLNS